MKRDDGGRKIFFDVELQIESWEAFSAN